MNVEDGLTIARQTLCKVGNHRFSWTGPLPPDSLWCDCGLVPWQRPKPVDPR